MSGQVQKSEIATMSTFVLHGTVHGRFGGLRPETGKPSPETPKTLFPTTASSDAFIVVKRRAGEMSGMPSGTPDTVQRRSRISDERDSAAFPGASHRDHRRATGSDERTDDETLRRVFGKSVRHGVRSLRERRVHGLQRCSYGHSEKGNRPDQ